jgi:hypothetical protein
MADGLFLYKTEDGYVVMNEIGFILKSAKSIKTCERYIQLELQSRRTAEREAIEKVNQDKNQYNTI